MISELHAQVIHSLLRDGLSHRALEMIPVRNRGKKRKVTRMKYLAPVVYVLPDATVHNGAFERHWPRIGLWDLFEARPNHARFVVPQVELVNTPKLNTGSVVKWATWAYAVIDLLDVRRNDDATEIYLGQHRLYPTQDAAIAAAIIDYDKERI